MACRVEALAEFDFSPPTLRVERRLVGTEGFEPPTVSV